MMSHFTVALALRFLFWMLTLSFITLLALLFWGVVFKRVGLYCRICRERAKGIMQPVSNYQREMEARIPVLDIGMGDLSWKETIALLLKSFASLFKEYKAIFVVSFILGTLQAASFVLTPHWGEAGGQAWKGQSSSFILLLPSFISVCIILCIPVLFFLFLFVTLNLRKIIQKQEDAPEQYSTLKNAREGKKV